MADADPKRFEVSGKTLFLDTFMTRFIKIGGIGIIAAVFGIFIFIVLQVLPLFDSAHVRKSGFFEVDVSVKPVLMGADEWGELPFVLYEDGNIRLFSVDKKPVSEDGRLVVKPARSEQIAGLDGKITVARYFAKNNVLLLGTENGTVHVLPLSYSMSFEEGTRVIGCSIGKPQDYAGETRNRIGYVDFYETGSERMIVFAQGNKVDAVRYQKKKTLFGSAKEKFERAGFAEHIFEADVTAVFVTGLNDSLVVTDSNGSFYFVKIEDGTMNIVQRLRPFESEEDKRICSANLLLGNISVVLTSYTGKNHIYALSRDEKAGELLYSKIHEMRDFPGGASLYDYSHRNRAFVLAGKERVSLRYGTTESSRWYEVLERPPLLIFLGLKYDSLWLLDDAGRFSLYSIDDPHPESGFAAFFGKIHYEGMSEPAYIWQSTGAEASFEPKLSMIPLLFGSVKGTLYAMIFALPIALLSAVYTSQFLHPSLKRIVKPTMEIMASLPSVVLGFIGAIWVAPAIEHRIPSIIACIVIGTATCMLFGWMWTFMPKSVRARIRPGYEFIVVIPLVAVACIMAWHLGVFAEGIFIDAYNHATGKDVSDFRAWWSEFSGIPFEQRNSLVVGFLMGFAVIPLIFTIAEDALTNVPSYLTSASLALGASRWQTAWRIIMPTASPGVFSAFMIGLGRAVGETMIVVMCTGNTPTMNWNIFDGMRTLSANIAVELPEAPVHSTLYRSLFLGALLLFMLTFIVNTVAEVTRKRLREKYKTV